MRRLRNASLRNWRIFIRFALALACLDLRLLPLPSCNDARQSAFEWRSARRERIFCRSDRPWSGLALAGRGHWKSRALCKLAGFRLLFGFAHGPVCSSAFQAAGSVAVLAVGCPPFAQPKSIRELAL